MGQMTVNNIMIHVVKKNIQNIHLAVYPPDGRVRVAAPMDTDDKSVRLYVASKINWIKNKREKYLKQQRQTEREYITGESHYFKGHRYLLNVETSVSKKGVEIRNNKFMDLFVAESSSRSDREKLMTEWYMSELKSEIPPLVKKWQEKTDIGID